jgi:O-antigen ligase
MSLSRADRFAASLGFAPANNYQRACLAPAVALAAVLASLPWLLLLPLDTDRAVPLAFLPAVLAGWKTSRPSDQLDTLLLALGATAMLLAAAFSDHAARAFVMTSAVGWTLAGGLIARNLATCEAAVRLVLSGLLAGAVAGTVMLRLGVDSPTSTFPIYGSVRLFGAHQFFGCAAALGLLLYPTAKRSWFVLLVTAAIIVWTGLFWSGGRAPLVAVSILTSVWFWRGDSAERRRLLLWTPALVMVALGFAWLLQAPYEGMGWSSAVSRTVHATGIEQVSSDRSRFWSETWRYASEAPWLGHGADGYRFIAPNQNGSQPHNMLLQWFVEYGVLGLVPLALLLVRGIRGLFAPPASAFQHWSGAALAGAAGYGLLEGIFYHASAFMPVAVIAGLAFGTAQVTPVAKPSITRHAWKLLLLAAFLVILLHGWLGLRLLRTRDLSPDSATARILRVFPCTTTGLQKHIERWRQTQPELAMEWIHWAQGASTESASFHLYAAQLYIWQKNYKSAETELLHCLDKVHYLERPDVQIAIDTVRALNAGLPIPQAHPQP